MPRLDVYEAAAVAKAKAADAAARATKQRRKDDTHRKILLGSFLQETWKRQPELLEAMRHDLGQFINKDADRKLLKEWLQSTISEPVQ